MVLDEDVLFSELCLTLLKVLFLLAELFFLVLEGLLHFVHGTSLFQESGRR
jgi:hypothetical protein